MMWLWHLEFEAGDKPCVCTGFVIASTSVRDARNIASEWCGDEGPGVWQTERVTCERIGKALETTMRGVVLRSFKV